MSTPGSLLRRVRLLFVILALGGGMGVPLYIIAWIIMPQDEYV